MVDKIPSVRGKEAIKALIKAGFVERRTSGSHSILKNHRTGKIVVVPVHGGKDVKRGTLFAIIKQAGLTIDEFIKLL